MKLFQLLLKKDFPAGFDCTCQVLVRAKDEKHARSVANAETLAGDEREINPDCWLNPEVSECLEVSTKGEFGVIMTSPRVLLVGDE